MRFLNEFLHLVLAALDGFDFLKTKLIHFMMTLWHGILFRITGHLCGETTGRQWFPSQLYRALMFLCRSLNQTVEQTTDMLVI